jgi:hypothetical protein
LASSPPAAAPIKAAMDLFTIRRLLLATTAAISLTAICVAPASAGVDRHARTSSAAGAIAVHFAEKGAPYLVGKLKDGGLGSHGQSVGNFLGPFVENPQDSKLAELQAEVAALKLAIDQVRTHLHSVAAAVAQAQFSDAALQSSVILGSIDKARKELENLTLATTVHDREVHASHLIHQLGPGGNLYSAQEILHKMLTVPAVGADGLLIAANKAAKAKSNPFFTPTLSAAAHEVYKYYSMYEAVLLTLRVNYWNHKGISHTTIARDVHTFENELHEQRTFLKPQVVKHTAIDTRTDLTWTNSADGVHQTMLQWTTGNTLKPHARPLSNGVWIIESCYSACPHAVGGLWHLPTVAQLQMLASDTSGTPFTGWLHNRAHFAPFAVNWAWASPPPYNGVSWVFDVNNGDFTVAGVADNWGFIGMNDEAVAIPGYYYY